MTGNRMSALGLAQYCGRAASLSLGAGRSAAVSSAFHAMCAQAPDAQARIALLTDEERDELAELKPVVSTEFAGIPLHYADAYVEIEVGLNRWAGHCAADDPDCISVGHFDMAWVVQLPDGRNVALVGDIKRSEWTTPEGPRSLQLAAYGFAWSAAHQCDLFACGIWDATGGQWEWGELIDLASDEAGALWQRVKHAAQNVSTEYSMGPHCSNCYGRTRCPAYFLPPEEAEGALAKYGPMGITEDNAAEILLTLQRLESAAEAIKENLKAHARRLPIVSGNKRWMPIETKGRESFDKKRFAQDHPEMVATYTKQGAPITQFRWVNR